MKYKYIKEKHIESFLKHGELKLGTIGGYRETEDAERRDEHDGKSTFCFIPTSDDIMLSNDQANAITHDHRLLNGTGLVIKKEGFVSSDLIVPDVYTFCVSNSYSDKLLKKLGGACFSINDIKAFGESIFRELQQTEEMLFWTSGNVKYVDSKILFVTDKNKDTVIPAKKFKNYANSGIKEIQIDDFFTKTKDFQYQDEYRFVFVPRAKPKNQGIIIRNKEIAQFCKAV